MSVRLSPNLPANVVEIGNEITQAKLNEINAGVLATQSFVTSQGFLTASSLTGYATQSYVTSQGYLTDAPSNGSEYVRKNGAWSVATGGGGGGGVAWGAITGTVTDQTDLTTYISGLGYITSASLSVTNIDLTGNFNGYSMGSGYYTFKFDSSANTLRMQDGTGTGVTLGMYGLTRNVFTISTSIALSAEHTNNILNITGNYNISIPYDATYNFPIGTTIDICAQTGATVDTFMTSILLNGMAGSSYSLPTGVSTLIKVAADTWYIS